MTGFEPRISDIGSDHSTNCDTITAHWNYHSYNHLLTKLSDKTFNFTLKIVDVK